LPLRDVARLPAIPVWLPRPFCSTRRSKAPIDWHLPFRILAEERPSSLDLASVWRAQGVHAAGRYRGADRRADRVDKPRPADPPRQPPAQQVGPVPQARAPDADDAGCRARHRPPRPAPSGFVRRSGASPALGADRADPSLGVRVRPGPCTGVTSTWAPSEQNTSSKLRQNFASRSPSRNRTRRPRSSNTSSRLRACWVTQRLSGVGGHPDRGVPRGAYVAA
jgi:hypothetical protein